MRWLVTGGCGFIGTNLVKNLLEEGYEVKVLDNLSVGSKEQLAQVCTINKDVRLYVDDLTDYSEVLHICEDVDVIVHLAAMSGVRPSINYSRLWFDVNVLGTFNLFEAAKRTNVQRVISASSGAVIGEVAPPLHEELPMHPLSPYAASKCCMEMYAESYYHSYGLTSSCLRFSNVYGPYSGTKGSLVAKLTRRILEGKQFNIYGDGTQTRDFIHVNDLIGAIKKCVLNPALGYETFHISSGKEHSVNDVVSMILKEFENEKPTINYTDPKVGDSRANWADNTKAKEMLGWAPEIMLEDGIIEVIKWFKEDYEYKD